MSTSLPLSVHCKSCQFYWFEWMGTISMNTMILWFYLPLNGFSNLWTKGGKVLFIGKSPPPPWKSIWVMTRILGMGLSIRPHPRSLWLLFALALTLTLTLTLSLLSFGRALTWKLPRTLTGRWLESCLRFDLGVNLGPDFWLSSQLGLWPLTLTLTWFRSRLDLDVVRARGRDLIW